MMRRYTLLAWTAAAFTYILIVLGAVVRITGSGMGCGDHWPLCNGRLFPPLDDIGTVIEWSHRLVAGGIVSTLVVALAAYTWWLRRGVPNADRVAPARTGYFAIVILGVEVILGAITVKTGLTPPLVIAHLGTAMLLLATLLIAAAGRFVDLRPRLPLLLLTFVTVLFGALTANLGAAAACTGFPLCNGQVFPAGHTLVWVHWTHRLLAYTLAGYVIVWAARAPGRRPNLVLGLVALQVAVGAATVLLGLPGALQAAHVAVGAAVWAGVVLALL